MRDFTQIKTFDEWAELSELTPKESFSIADHALTALRLFHEDAPQNLSIADYLALGIPTAPEDPE